MSKSTQSDAFAISFSCILNCGFVVLLLWIEQHTSGIGENIWVQSGWNTCWHWHIAKKLPFPSFTLLLPPPFPFYPSSPKKNPRAVILQADEMPVSAFFFLFPLFSFTRYILIYPCGYFTSFKKVQSQTENHFIYLNIYIYIYLFSKTFVSIWLLITFSSLVYIIFLKKRIFFTEYLEIFFCFQ